MARVCDPKEPFVKIPVRLIKSDKLTPYDKTIFSFLMCFNPSFPSLRFISKSLGIAKSTVQESITRLLSTGALVRESGDNSRSNRYKSAWGGPPGSPRGPYGGTQVGRQAVHNQIKESDQLIISNKVLNLADKTTRRMPK